MPCAFIERLHHGINEGGPRCRRWRDFQSSRARGRAYWASWIIVATIALPLVAFFVVPPIKGEPVPELWPRFLVSMILNGSWGFGTALFLRLVSATREEPLSRTVG